MNDDEHFLQSPVIYENAIRISTGNFVPQKFTDLPVSTHHLQNGFEMNFKVPPERSVGKY